MQQGSRYNKSSIYVWLTLLELLHTVKSDIFNAEYFKQNQIS